MLRSRDRQSPDWLTLQSYCRHPLRPLAITPQSLVRLLSRLTHRTLVYHLASLCPLAMSKSQFIFQLPLIAALFVYHSLSAGLSTSPMLGPIEMREAKIWVQTTSPALVRIAYAKDGQESETIWSLPQETNSKAGNTALIQLSNVEPGHTYQYRVEVNGDLVDGSYQFSTPSFYHGRTPPPDFSIAVGGAHYVNQEGFEPPYQTLGGGYDIFETIRSTDPKLMIWLGNTTHLRESDWASHSGYIKRHTHARGLPQMSKLLANVPQYATWGVSDYGGLGAGSSYSYRSYAETTFLSFWPSAAPVSELNGIATRFRYADVDFFLLDTRSFRNDHPTSTSPVEILGAEQIEWLRAELVRSKATFKIVAAGAPILNPADSQTNLSYADSEHTRLLQMFRDEDISGLFFLSGGKYYGELTRLVHANSYNLFDLTLGPLTATPKDNQEELNYFRMPGTSVFERHFANLEFSGPEDERVLTIRVINENGDVLWSRKVSASELLLED